MDYQHLDTSKNEIRVLTVLPSPATSQLVRLRLEHVSLDDLKPGCIVHRLKPLEGSTEAYPYRPSDTKTIQNWIAVLAVLPSLRYLFIWFSVSRISFHWLRHLLHLLNLVVLSRNFDQALENAVLLRCSMDHVDLLRAIYDGVLNLAILAPHFPRWAAVFFIASPLGLWHLHQGGIRGRLSSAFPTSRKDYALEIQIANYGTSPDQSRFRFIWGD